MARRRSGKKIDFVHWTGMAGASLAQSAGSVGVSLNPAQHEPETLMRLRGTWSCYLDGTQAPGALIDVAIGVVLVPEGTGTSVLWTPLTDVDGPFIWYDRVSLGYEEYVTDVIDCPQMTSYRSVIDNKAMRIIRNQEIQLVIEQATTGGAASVNVNFCVRGLFGT